MSLLAWRGGSTLARPVSRSEIFPSISGLQDLEAAHQGLVDRHHGSRVVELATVVWRTEQSHELPPLEELIAIFYHLVSPAYQIEVVLRVELPHDVLAKGEADASIVVAVFFHAALGIRPQQVTEEPSVGDIRGSHDVLDLLEVPELWREAAMHAEYLFIDKSCDR